MKKINTKWLKVAVVACGSMLLFTTSCDESDFLNVPRTDQLSTDIFPARAEDFDFLLFDLYGRLKNTYYHTNYFPRFGTLMSHEADQAYIGPEFNFHAQNSLTASNQDLTFLWNALYEHVSKANSFLASLEQFRQKNPDLAPATSASLSQKEGEARFLRAFYYFQLINLFGESFIYEPADRDKMGIPLFTQRVTNIDEASKGRSTVGDVWDFITEELLKAEALLSNVTSHSVEKARVTKWAVKGLLGRGYLYTRQFAKAKEKLKDIIDNSGKKLVSVNVYKNMFNGLDQFEFNEESIFEINYNHSAQSEWSGWPNMGEQTSNFSGVLMAPTFMNADRKYAKNGFGNLYVHDKNLMRFGYTYPDKVDQKNLKDGDVWKSDQVVKTALADYLTHARTVRQTKSVDPRLFVGAFQPYADSVYFKGGLRPIVKNEGEGTSLANNYAWSIRKNIDLDRNTLENALWYQGNNYYVIRLADVYLMYAEALAETGEAAPALEYVNKVKRRAYGHPVDAASPVDYASLTAATTATDPVLRNNPLRYERFAELFLEGHWWFDVVRWRIGSEEASYYERVGSGPLSWNNRAYRMPIPELEMNANKNLAGQQNPGY